MDLDDDELQATRILNGADTREHRIYAIKFAVMQKQIDEKDKRIKELEEEKKNSIPKQKIKDKIKELANIKGDLKNKQKHQIPRCNFYLSIDIFKLFYHV